MTNEELFQRLNAGDKSARDELIIQNQPLVMVVLKRYPRRNDPVNSLEDLISVGTLGLIKAVDSFDTAKGYEFSTYAAKCILNQLFKLYRRIQREVDTFSLNSIAKGASNRTWADVIPDREKRMENRIEEQDMIMRGIHSVSNLANLQKNAIVLHILSDGRLLQREIAKQLGVSQPHCSRAIRDAQRNLRKLCEYNQ